MVTRFSEFLRSNTGFGVALAVAAVLCTYITCQTVYQLRTSVKEMISVKGASGEAVQSDTGTWKFNLSVRAPSLEEAVAKLEAQQRIVMAFLETEGFQPAEIGISQPQTFKNFKKIYIDVGNNTERMRETDEIESFTLRLEFQVGTKNLDILQTAAAHITDLMGAGLSINAQPLEFRVSDLEAVKMRVLAKAIENGRERAQLFLAGAPEKTLALASASQGVFQITPPHDTEISSYGRDDTTTIDKVARAVVTIQFAVK